MFGVEFHHMPQVLYKLKNHHSHSHLYRRQNSNPRHFKREAIMLNPAATFYAVVYY
jgi:hypothetical protein